MGCKQKMMGDVAVIQVKGKLMGGPETIEVHEHLKNFVEGKTHKIVIDLSKVKWLNSSGIGMLMACLTTVRNAGGELVISGAIEKVNSAFMVTKLITLFQSFDSVDEAVASFEKV